MHRREIKSYVIREGRITIAQKKALVSHWPKYGLEVADGLINPCTLFSNQQPLVLEIGFGMGSSLFETALAHQGQNFLGVEVHRPGIGHLLHLVAGAELHNLRIYSADSIDVLSRCLPGACLDKIQIFFPDPWHKKKHRKRRMINSDFVGLLAKPLKTGGIVHIATDWADYAEQIRLVFRDWHNCDTPERPITKYERRGLRLDHEVFDLAFKTCIENTLHQS